MQRIRIKQIKSKLVMENIKDYTKNIRNWEFTGEKPIIMDFYATWCGPCKSLAPTLEEIAKEYKDTIKVIKVDIDKNAEFADICFVKSVPTLFFISKDGTFKRVIGAQAKDVIKNIIDNDLLNE